MTVSGHNKNLKGNRVTFNKYVLANNSVSIAKINIDFSRFFLPETFLMGSVLSSHGKGRRRSKQTVPIRSASVPDLDNDKQTKIIDTTGWLIIFFLTPNRAFNKGQIYTRQTQLFGHGPNPHLHQQSSLDSA